jgi:hypothetical protein
MSEAKFYTHTEKQTELEFCVFPFLYFFATDGKTEDIELNVSKCGSLPWDLPQVTHSGIEATAR